MGRKRRERIQRIREGKELSIRQQRDMLMHEIVKRASEDLVFNPEWSHRKIESTVDDIYKVVVDVLPESLNTVNRHRFSIADLTRKKDMATLYGRVIRGVLLGNSDKFVKKDNKAEYWGSRKRKATRPMTGEWKLCDWCGSPFYAPPSRRSQRYHSRDCYWTAYRARKDTQPLNHSSANPKAAVTAVVT